MGRWQSMLPADILATFHLFVCNLRANVFLSLRTVRSMAQPSPLTCGIGTQEASLLSLLFSWGRDQDVLGLHREWRAGDHMQMHLFHPCRLKSPLSFWKQGHLTISPHWEGKIQSLWTIAVWPGLALGGVTKVRVFATWQDIHGYPLLVPWIPVSLVLCAALSQKAGQGQVAHLWTKQREAWTCLEVRGTAHVGRLSFCSSSLSTPCLLLVLADLCQPDPGETHLRGRSLN